MDISTFFGLFRTYVHGEPSLGPLFNILGPGCLAAGVSTNRSRILPSVNACPGRGVTPGAYAWHLPNLHHNDTHVLGAHASFHVIPTLRWSSSDETLDRGPPIVYPYSNLRTRVARWTFLFVLVCLVHVHGEQWLGQLCHILGPGCPAAGVSTYRPRISLSVNACPGRGSHLAPIHGTYQPCTTITHLC